MFETFSNKNLFQLTSTLHITLHRFAVMKEVSYDYLSCIYLSENMLKTATLKVFYFNMF